MKSAFLLSVLTFFTMGVGLAIAFQPPGPKERLKAIGPVQGVPKELQLALDPMDFEPLPVPGSGDWLAVHPEPGQSFDEFRDSKPNKPEGRRRRIYLYPLGKFPQDRSPSLDMLKEYAAAFFCLETKLISPLEVSPSAFTTRRNPFSGHLQILTTDILSFLKKRVLDDAFCLLAITMEDLYPHPSWNFVFGQASLQERVGVFSFARYDPSFYGERWKEKDKDLLLLRSCRVLAHETAHMFSLAHCIFFRCALNGSNHLQESDSRPLHLCPVCLRKLQFSIGFDVADRYKKLLDFYRRAGFAREKKWVADRVKKITGRLE